MTDQNQNRTRKLVYTGFMSANGRGEFTIGGDAPWQIVKLYHKRLSWHREIEFFFAPLAKSAPEFLETTAHIIDTSRSITRSVPGGFSAGYLRGALEQTLTSIPSCYNSYAILIVTFRENPADPVGN